MPTFAYVVKDKAGHTLTGTLETESRSALIERLWKQDCVILSVEERQAGRPAMGPRAPRPTVKMAQLVIFSRQLATMVESGMPIISSLDILAEQITDRTFQGILRTLRDDVRAGSGLSDAMARHPSVFTEFMVHMVRAGESAGHLDEMLDRVASYVEKVEAMARKVRASLFYPAFVSVLALSITTVLVVYIVPQFKEIFSSLGSELPLPTQLLLSVSDFIGRYYVMAIFAAAAALVAFRVFITTQRGRLWFDRLKLHLLVIGPLLQKVAIARFARTLATLVNAGVPILSALEIVAKTTGNRVIEVAVMSARASIREGESIATPLAQSRVFPPMVTRMVAIGEKTGALEKMLVKIADYYESEVDAAVMALTSLIEPVVIAVLGVLIGGIVVALFLPIFQLSSILAR